MKVYDSIAAARAAGFRRTIATLGVFDGVHVGHRFVLRECIRLAAERAAESVVITFRTHPRAVIAQKAPKLITSIDHRFRLFAELGVAHCVALTFDDALRRMTARRFAHEVFEEVLRSEIVVLGHNCSFGADREGDADFLIANASEFSFETRKAPEIRIGEHICSSTQIREAIIAGDLDQASSLLGRPYAVLGTVVNGDHRGRTIGFPTANLDLHHELKPPRGVWGCRVDIDGAHHYALTNIGVRPTFAGQGEPQETVEVHVLDFSGDLYGRELEVIFLKRLRGEMKFPSVDALKQQIAADRLAFNGWLDRGSGVRSPMRSVDA